MKKSKVVKLIAGVLITSALATGCDIKPEALCNDDFRGTLLYHGERDDKSIVSYRTNSPFAKNTDCNCKDFDFDTWKANKNKEKEIEK